MAQDDWYDEDDGLIDDSFVRPFIITGGRGDSTLPIEAMVMSVPAARAPELAHSDEYRTIYRLCSEAQSIAEISARAKLPLGVVRVLVNDLVKRGALNVATNEKLGAADELAFLDRIIAGVEVF